MTVSQTSVLTPMAAALPPDTDLDAILVDLSDNHVATPAGMDQSGLAALVADADAHGIPLSIVVVAGNRGRDSDLRDLATAVGKHEHGTVAVFSDDWAGTYSDSISRAHLERAEDVGKNWGGGHSQQAAHAFVSNLEQPEMVPWTAVTCVLVGGTAAVIAGLYLVKRRRALSERPESEPARRG